VLVHGLQSHAGWFSDAGTRLADRGLAVYAPDRRGSGRSAAKRGDVADFRDWYADLFEVIDLARAEYPGLPIHLVGHCFGANLALGCALDGRQPVRSIIMLTPGLFVLPKYSPLEAMNIAIANLLAPCARFRVPQDDTLFSRDPEVLAWIGADTLGVRSVTARALVQINRMLHELRAGLPLLSVPLLVLEAGRDRLADNHRNRALIVSALGNRCRWQTFDAEHFLLAEACRDQVIDAVARWTASHP
jgi:alpha-beta hydrolase superfamily lysophospholipase